MLWCLESGIRNLLRRFPAGAERQGHPGKPAPPGRPACWSWWFQSELAVLKSEDTEWFIQYILFRLKKNIVNTILRQKKKELKMNWFLSSNLFSLPRNVLEVRRDITDLPAEACVLGASVHWWCAAWPGAWSPSGSSLDLQHLNAWWQAEPLSLFPPSPCD